MADRTEALLSAQTAVLGSMLIDDRCVPVVLDSIREEYFTAGQYRAIFSAIRQLAAGGKRVDPVVVLAVVGKEYTDLVSQIMQVTPTAANIRQYCKILRQEARIRLMQDAAGAVLSAETEDEIRAALDSVNAVMVDRPGVQAMTMEQALSDFYQRHGPEVKPDFLPWRFEKLEGLRVQRGDLVILGGYPSDGKTTLALTTAREQAKKKRVGFFSFETSCAKLTDAMVCAAAQIGLPRIQLNAMSEHDWETVAAISSDFSGRRLEIIEASGMTVQDIRLYSMARHYDVIYIDYLQLIAPPAGGGRMMTEFDRVTANSVGLKQFGRQGGPAIVALSQMSRPQPGKNGKIPPPSMSSLRSSGQIEQDADLILLLFREDQKKVDCDRVVTVAKNKTGEAGYSVVLQFDGEHQSFRESRRDWKPPAQTPAQQMGFAELDDVSPVPF